ncbi:Hypp536 [Branchiostoma lanceolatum]|uniref:Hypp536 protein n=1 Tax=Branchiostoma lanceolatum TaxID=7740 RepID=A0A8J9WDT5_BRALA|nr:Hypp536 [Branchiostoma lanceolatum]
MGSFLARPSPSRSCSSNVAEGCGGDEPGREADMSLQELQLLAPTDTSRKDEDCIRTHQVFIKDLDGRTKCVDVAEGSTVEELMSHLKKEEILPPGGSLVAESKKLKKSQLVGKVSCNIEVALALNGGVPPKSTKPKKVPRRKKAEKRKVCPGCQANYSSQAFRNHRSRFYDEDSKSYTCVKEDNHVSHCSETEFSTSASVSEPEHDMPNSVTDSEPADDGRKLKNTKNHAEEDISSFYDVNESFQDQSDSEDEEIWLENSGIAVDVNIDEEFENSYSNDEHRQTSGLITSLLHWLCWFILLWQAKHFISDTAINQLFHFIGQWFDIASKHSPFIAALSPIFPGSIYLAWKHLNYRTDKFMKYVVCTKCCTLYDYSDCKYVLNGREESKRCSFVKYINHPQRQHRRPCGQKLLKSIKLPSGKTKLVPFKIYCYKSLKESISALVRRSGFEESCELWRKRSQNSDKMSDIYDGKIWKEFNDPQKHDFFTKEGNYGLVLNVDWFQPFKHVKYSVGVIYLAVANLPREERFKRNNIIIVGIIPDMKVEPPTKTFIEPLVEELMKAWTDGFKIKSFLSGKHEKTFRLALICVGCDIPATRKLCGFLGHTATQGCSRCKKSFPGGIGEKLFGGFDIANWIPRTHEDHLASVNSILKSKTQTEQQELERTSGARFSPLINLPYFDIIRMSTVDPMHNLFLGTAKRVIEVWKDLGILTDKMLHAIQEKVDNVEAPSDIGKIPRKIASCFGGFTADQLKNWTIIFSVFALKDVIKDEDLECWRKFVLACRLISSRVVTKRSIELACKLLVEFCKKFESLYGADRVTPNMHLHAHLKDCMEDFGPVYSFWLFSFERLNGILGDQPNNNREVELQIMRKFDKERHLLDVGEPTHFSESFSQLTSSMVDILKEDNRGTNDGVGVGPWGELSSYKTPLENKPWSINEKLNVQFEKGVASVLIDDDFGNVVDMYKTIYPSLPSNTFIPRSYLKLKTIRVTGSVIGSYISRSSRSSYILANWAGNDGHIQDYSEMYRIPRPGRISYFLKHIITSEHGAQVHLLAKVEWYSKVADSVRTHCGQPVEAWHPTVFDAEGPASFLPVQRLKCKFVKAPGKVHDREVMFVCPRDRYFSY